MRTLTATTLFLALSASMAYASDAHLFLSQAGLSNPGDTQSAAISAAVIQSAVNLGDPVVQTGGVTTTVRFHLWAIMPDSPTSDLDNLDLAFQTSGNVTILNTNIWDNSNGFVDSFGNFVQTYSRWDAGGFPGLQSWNAQLADTTPTQALAADGITTRLAADDDQRRPVTFNSTNHYAILFGFVEVSGTQGNIDLIHQGANFRPFKSTARIHLGADDGIGEEADFRGSYNNASPEAQLVPEPSSLALSLLPVLLACGRQRHRQW